jgi:hypothetical protein
MIARIEPACGKELSMRSLATFCLVIVATAALSQAVAGEAETIEAMAGACHDLVGTYLTKNYAEGESGGNFTSRT